MLKKRLDKAGKNAKSGDKVAVSEKELLEKNCGMLREKVKRSLVFSSEEEKMVKDFFLITAKPVIYVANIGEDEIGKETSHYLQLKEVAQAENAEIIAISAKIEEELSVCHKKKADFMLTWN